MAFGAAVFKTLDRTLSDCDRAEAARWGVGSHRRVQSAETGQKPSCNGILDSLHTKSLPL